MSKITFLYPCSKLTTHYHRYRWTAWCCGRIQHFAFWLDGGWEKLAKRHTKVEANRQYFVTKKGTWERLKK
jgi:hypothetical protein